MVAANRFSSICARGWDLTRFTSVEKLLLKEEQIAVLKDKTKSAQFADVWCWAEEEESTGCEAGT